MRGLRRFFRRLTSWVTVRRDERRLRAEIEEHLALQTAENIRAGMSPAEARRQAALKFGAVEAMKERYREQRGVPAVERLIQDTRHALRRLRMAPAFTIATVLILALGIGATTSIFTLVHAVMLKSLPVAKPGNCTAWGNNPIAVTTASTASIKSSPSFPTICTNTCGTTPKALRNWRLSRRLFKPLRRRLASGGRAARRRRGVMEASSSRAITSACSASEDLPDGCSRRATISRARSPWR